MLAKIAIIYYLGLSVLTAAMLGFDKRQARLGRPRAREHTLHSFELLGGWPGALIATRAFNHKHRKRGYMYTLYAFALLHVIFWLVLLWLATA